MLSTRALLFPFLVAATMVVGQARADEAFDAVVQARRQCAASAPPLRPQPQLDDAAARLARGSSLATALQASGYRAQRSYEWRLSGYPSPQAVAAMLVRGHCDTLSDPALTDLGIRRSGNSYWIVLAAPFAPPPQADAGSVAARVLALVNQARAQPRRCGDRLFNAAAPLALDAALTRAAAVHAESMARGGYLEHEGRDGSSPAQRATRAGYDWRTLGENIAMGQTTPELVVRAWLKSAEHCANIMEPAFTQMGVAFAVNNASEGGIYWAQEFGRPR
ncbi:MAG: CAP domain-containing protein [Ramlibacter sp.]